MRKIFASFRKIDYFQLAVLKEKKRIKEQLQTN